MKYRKYIGHVGDSNPLEHIGGIVLRNTDGSHSLIHFYPVPDDCLPPGTGERWDIHIIDLDADYWDWIDTKDLSQSCGIDESIIKDAMKSDDPMVLASLAESIGWYYGFGELDYYPRVMTRAEINRLWGRWV